MPTTDLPVPLDSLDVDSCARFCCAELDGEARELLRGLGLTDGARVRVCQRGETCIVQVHGRRIGITSRVARSISVVPISAAPARA